MTLLEKLNALQASPGPWRVVTHFPEGNIPGYAVLTDGDRNVSLRASDLYEADAKLASLAPFIPRLVEALEGFLKEAEDYGFEFSQPTVLAELEEALYG